ncbi:MAG: hypothetical protein WD850_02975 [Candidatus Spechtbacterales bacterium]
MISGQRYTALILACSAVGIFALGFVAASVAHVEKSPIVVERLTSELYSTAKSNEAQEVNVAERTGRVVGSINSDKYHFEYCSGASSIKEDNQVWFASPQEAQEAGYTLAGNCTP